MESFGLGCSTKRLPRVRSHQGMGNRPSSRAPPAGDRSQPVCHYIMSAASVAMSSGQRLTFPAARWCDRPVSQSSAMSLFSFVWGWPEMLALRRESAGNHSLINPQNHQQCPGSVLYPTQALNGVGELTSVQACQNATLHVYQAG